VSRSYNKRQGFKPIKELSEAIREEELLDTMLLLYHLGLAQNFKQVFTPSVCSDFICCVFYRYDVVRAEAVASVRLSLS
jgi:hypothetical protein